MKKTQDECSKALTFTKGEKADFFDVSFFRMVILEINVKKKTALCRFKF